MPTVKGKAANLLPAMNCTPPKAVIKVSHAPKSHSIVFRPQILQARPGRLSCKPWVTQQAAQTKCCKGNTRAARKKKKKKKVGKIGKAIVLASYEQLLARALPLFGRFWRKYADCKTMNVKPEPHQLQR